MTPAQSRAARALVEMTQPKLAGFSGLSLSTVVDFERARRTVSKEAIGAMLAALEAAGVIFVEENGEGPGVRLRKQRGPDLQKPIGPATDAIEAMDAAISKHRMLR